MNPSGESRQRVILRQAVRQLIAAATSERASMAERSEEWHFYLGVDAAAQEVLHPELAASRAPGWIDREAPAFRDGYLQTTTMLSGQRTAEQPRISLPLPSSPRPT